MPLPSTPVDTTRMDEDTDVPPRAAILDLTQKVNAIISLLGAATGIALLDGSGQVLSSQLDLALLKAGNLSGLANLATARQNLGATATGAALFTAADVAAVKTLLGYMGAGGGTFSGAPKYAATPGDDDTLARKKYVDDQVATKQTAIKLAVLADYKSPGSNGGTFTSGDWRVRTLNSEIYDPSAIVTLDAPNNRFTLGAGTYEIDALVPAFEVSNHRARLWNVTDGTVSAYGTNARSLSNTQTASRILVHLILAGTKVFQVEHRCLTTRDTFGFGYADNLGTNEIYTQVKITKTA